MQVKAQFAIGLTVWCALAMSARGQSFNIDIGATSGAGAGAPSATFGGAAEQKGLWNNLAGTSVVPLALGDINGVLTTATLSRTSGSGGNFSYDNTHTTGNHASLLDDGQDIGAAGGVVTYTISGLAAGNYGIYVYAIAPDNSTTTTVSYPPPAVLYWVGGPMPINKFVPGVTHTVLRITLTATGSINIRVANGSGSGRCNGIQIVRRQYVNANATGANNGRNWTDAYTSLQSALVAGATGEVLVAAGTYKPATSTDRTLSFQLQNDLAVYGGFNGTEEDIGLRDPVANPTILSGDIGVVNDATDNSYHVVEAAGTVNSTARLDGFTIQGGTANGSSPDNRGGGLLLAGSPVIRNCIIANSTSINGGGGVQGNGSAVLVDCVIRSNTTTTAGFNGGGVYVGSGTLTLVNSVVAQNSAAAAGGGIAIQNAGATVNCHNCIFNANSSGTHGGAAVSLIGSLNAINCTFVNNNAPSAGGAVVRNNSGVVANLTNCVTRSNTGSSQFIANGPTNITYSNIQGGFTGAGNIDADPLFADADGLDNVAGNVDDDLRILSLSPCRNTGNATLLPADSLDLDNDGNTSESLPLDVRGRPRVGDAQTDIGAFEISPIYVRAAATGGNDGTSWADAYTLLKSALIEAGDRNFEEIWLAAGVYPPVTPPFTPHTPWFSLVSGVAIYGGFAGTETALSQRNVSANASILSGDFIGNDDGTAPNYSDNAPHVLNIESTVSNAVMDGLTIRSGRATQVAPDDSGAGIWCAGQATLRNCVIAQNTAHVLGAGVYNTGSISLIDCAIKDNYAAGSGSANGGAGVFNSGDIVLNGCLVRNNFCGAFRGAGLRTDGGSVSITRCAFESNVCTGGSGDLPGGIGGAVHKTAGSLTAINSTFINNSGGSGGGISATDAGGLVVRNCNFTGNAATYFPGGLGGAIYAPLATGAIVSNSIFWGNLASSRHMQLYLPAGATVTHCVIGRGIENAVADGAPGAGWTNLLDVDPLLTPHGRLRSGSPCINAGLNLNAPVDDIDGEPRPSGAAVDIGADEFIDSDGDGLPNAWELRYFGSTTSATASGDNDQDVYPNIIEYEELGTNPNLAPIYVSNSGLDTNPGTQNSPKRTIQAGIDAVADGSTVLVSSLSGNLYTGPGNRDLDTRGKSMLIRGLVNVDCTGGRFINEVSLKGAVVIIDGFTISGSTSTGNGGALALGTEARLQVRECVFGNNTAAGIGPVLYCSDASPVFSDGAVMQHVITPGSEDRIANSNFRILSNWTWNYGILDMRSSTLTGTGDLILGPNATLAIKGYGPLVNRLGDQPTMAYTDIRGTGDIIIDPGQELRLVNGATIDLSGALGTTPCASTPLTSSGTVTINGKLIASGGRVQNTNVVVNQGSLRDDTAIVHNDISMPEAVPASPTTPGFGGEFFVENDSTICGNHIISYGDRYLDIDPLADAQNQTISDNTIDVIITQSTANGQGELLELRAYDYSPNDPCPGWPAPCAILMPLSDPGFSDKWAINTLEVRENARVTLTNRKNFNFSDAEFGTPDPLDPPLRDTIYVRKLILHPNSVLNVGLQRVYFGSIVNESGVVLTPNPSGDYGGGRRIIDVPLLGFSLKVINFEDPTMPPSNEMDVRLRTRVQDDPTLDPSLPTTPLGEVVRTTATASTPSGTQLWNVMAMDTQATGHPAVTHVAAKGAFARCGEDEIEVAFLYDFDATSSADAVLSVYLSDSPDQGQSLGPLLATVRPPSTGVAGSISSTKFATFRGKFARGDLDMRRGTFIELKLTGTNARVLIDDFDPLVCGSFICGDLGGEQWYDGVVTGADFLYLLSQQGRPRDGSNYCTDSMIADSYVDMGDILMWEAQSHTPGMNLCASGSGSPSGSASQAAANVPDAELIIAGKEKQMVTPPGQLERYPTRLFDFNPGTAKVGLGGLPHGASQSIDSVGYGRLLRRSTGELFQLHSGYGILPFASGPAFVPPGQKSFTGGASMVHVGFTAAGDKPILDAVFDRTDPAVVYVVPVRVAPNSNPLQKYKAAAKLRHNPLSADYSVERLYGLNPYLDNSNNTTPPEFAAANVQNPREIEVDNFGNVFVISAIGDANNGNNWLLIYRFDTGAETRVPLSSSITDPSAMLVTTNKIYLAAGLNGAVDNQTFVYRFSINYSGTAAIGATLDSNGTYTIHDMRQVTAMTLGANGALRVVGYVAPTFDPNHAFGPVEDMFATPVMATLFASPQTVTAVAITGGNLSPPLSLPLSVVLANTGCPGPKGDFNGDQLVNAADIPGFINVMMNGTGGSSQTLCRADFTGDGFANGRDIDGFVQMIIP